MIKRRKRLKVMKFLCDEYYKTYRERVGFYTVCKNTKFKPDELKGILLNLESDGYIKYLTKEDIDKELSKESFQRKTEKVATQDFVSLTGKGKSYFEVKSDEKSQFIRRSIIIPILVSILTTILLWMLQYLIVPNLLQLLSLLCSD